MGDTQCRSQDFVGIAAGVMAPSWNFKKGECPKAEAKTEPICRVTYKGEGCKGDPVSYTPMTAGGCQKYVETTGPNAGLYYDVAGKGLCKNKDCTDCKVPNAKKTPGAVVYDTQCRSQDFVGIAAGVMAPSWNFKKGECPKAEGTEKKIAGAVAVDKSTVLTGACLLLAAALP